MTRLPHADAVLLRLDPLRRLHPQPRLRTGHMEVPVLPIRTTFAMDHASAIGHGLRTVTGMTRLPHADAVLLRLDPLRRLHPQPRLKTGHMEVPVLPIPMTFAMDHVSATGPGLQTA